MSFKSKSLYVLLAGMLLLQACSISPTQPPVEPIQTLALPTPTQLISTPTQSILSNMDDPVIDCSLHEQTTQPNTSPFVKLEQFGKGNLLAATYSPDGSLIAIQSGIGVYFYDTRTFEQVRFVDTYQEPRSMTFSNDGSLFALATRSVDKGTVIVYKVSSWEKVCTFTFQHEVGAAFSPDGSVLATFGSNLQLWSLPTGKKVRTISEHPCWAISFSPDGKIIVGSDEPGTLKLWDVETGKELKVLGESQRGTDIPIPTSILFSPDQKSLIVRYMPSGRFVFWNIETGDHKSLSDDVRTLSPDLTKAASFSWASTQVFVSDLKDMVFGARTEIDTTHTDYVNKATFSPDTTTLLTISDDNTVKVWNIANRAELHTFTGFSNDIESMALSPNQSILAIGAGGSYNKWIKLLNAKTGEEIQQLTGHEDIIFALDFSPDGTKLVSGSRDGTAKIWNVQTGKEVYTSEKLDLMLGVDFSPDGKLLATTAPDVVLLETLQSLGATYITDDVFMTACVAFSPDGKILAWGGGMFDEFGLIDLFDAATGQQLTSLKGHTNLVETVSFSPDGKLIASGSWDETAKVWDVATGEEVYTFDGDSTYVEVVSFSPDGKWLAVGLLNHKIKIWDISTGHEIATLMGHSSVVSDLQFSKDGKLLYSSSWDGTVIVWGVQ